MAVEKDVLQDWGGIMQSLDALEEVVGQGDWLEAQKLASVLDQEFRDFFQRHSIISVECGAEIARHKERIIRVLTGALSEAEKQKMYIKNEALGLSRGQKMVKAYKKV